MGKRHKVFQIGDVVLIAKDLGPSMRHFACDIDAIVMETYNTEYGSGAPILNDDYGLYIRGRGYCSWYHPSQLTKIGRMPGIRGMPFPTRRQFEKACERYFKSK